jgi:hypothetical protein
MEMASFRKLFGKALAAGIILINNTLGYRTPGGKDPAAAYNTGDRVAIGSTKSVPGDGIRKDERFYEIARGSDAVWVPVRAVRVLKEGEDPDAVSFSADFYRRAAKNKNDEARALGARGLLRRLRGRELLEAWMSFQGDEADEVRCAANESFSARLGQVGLPDDPRFDDDLFEALIRVRRAGNWREQALCGLGWVLAKSSHPDKIALQRLLSERDLGERPAQAGPQDVSRARALLERGLDEPEGWVRRNLISQVCGENVSTETVKVLSERFPSMTPEDKEEVVAHDYYPSMLEAARPLERRIVGLIGDKSQPAKLRLAALGDYSPRAEKRDALRKAVGDPEDGLRLDLAAKFCEYRDVLEEVANHGDETAFTAALSCLDGHVGKLGGIELHERLSEWAVPSLPAALESIADPKRRAQLDRRLKCLLGQALCPVSLTVDPDSH